MEKHQILCQNARNMASAQLKSQSAWKFLSRSLFSVVLLFMLLCRLAPMAQAAAPANDNFSNAEVLPNTASGSITGDTTVGATKEPGEPAHGNNVGNASIWYQWTPQIAEQVTFDTVGSDFDTLLSAYTSPPANPSVSNLTLVEPDALNDDLGPGKNSPTSASRIRFHTTVGTTYYIAVDGYNAAQGNVSLRWNPTPANDDFVNTQVITGTSGTVAGTNLGATRQSGEDRTSSVWYKWTAPAGRGRVTFNDTDSANPVSSIGVFTGTSLTNLVTTAVSYGLYNTTDGVRFPIVPSTTYLIVLDTSPGAEGNFNLNWHYDPNPANDDFANAQTITGASGTASGTNLGATHEAAESTQHAGVGSETSVWYKWTAPATGLYTFDTKGSALSTQLLEIYTGSSLSNLTTVAAHDSSWDHVRFRATAGTTYYIAIDTPFYGAAPEENTFDLNWTATTAPANDNFASAQLLPNTAAGSVSSTNVGSTYETGEQIDNQTNTPPDATSVWFRWTAPASGGYTFTLSNINFSSIFNVYSGSSLPALTPAYYRSSYGTGATFWAAGGTQYFIRVNGSAGAEGTFTLSWTQGPPNDDFANDAALSGANGSIDSTNVGATVEPDEAALGGFASVWYQWTAPTNSLVTFSLTSNFSSYLTVYTGTALSNLTLYKQNSSTFTIAVTGGTTYYFKVDGNPYNGGEGNFTLTWNTVTAPSNDNFANAIALTPAADGSIDGSNVGATLELGENDTGGSSVWYTWTPPGRGRVTFGITPGFNVGFYSGTSVDNLTGLPVGIGRTQVIPGTIYRISVDQIPTGNFTLTWHYDPTPANDDFANATNLNTIGTNIGTVTGSTLGATVETGEPPHENPYGPYNSIWYKWTAPGQGRVSFDSTNSASANNLAAYTGTGYGDLQRVNYTGIAPATGIRFQTAPGTTYYIALDGVGNEGDTSMTWTFTPAPANDDFAGAIALTPAGGTLTASNVAATQQDNEPTICGDSPQTSIWYKWTPTSSGPVSIDTNGSDIGNEMAVYTGTFANLNRVIDQVGQGTGQLISRVSWKAVANTTYYVQVSGTNYAEGNLTLNWNSVTPPANDDFVNAQLISGASGTVSGTNVNATFETGEPDHQGIEGGKSVWYKWVSPDNGKASFNIGGSDFYTLMAVYTGSSVDALTVVTQPYGSFSAQKNHVYYIAVDGNCGADGNIVLNWTFVVSPSNDFFADRQAISDANATILPDGTRQVTGFNTGAAKEPGEPDHASNPGGASVWFSFLMTAPTSNFTFTTQGSDFSTLLAVYTSSVANPTFAQLQPVASAVGNGGDASVAFNAVNGTTYYVAVDGQSPGGNGANGAAEGNILLSWRFAPTLSVNLATTPVTSPVSITEGATNPAATGTVQIMTAPTQDTDINLSSDNPLVTVPATVTIHAGQTVSDPFDINVGDDYIASGTRTVNIGASKSGLISGSSPIFLHDNDVAGVTVMPTSGLVTSEDGTQASFTVALTSQPTANVIINLTSSKTTEGTVSPTNLTFDATNWNQPQTVTITGVADGVHDGDQAYTIHSTVSSTDPNYPANMTVTPVSVTNTDIDPANPTTLTLTIATNPVTTPPTFNEGAGDNAATGTVTLDSPATTDLTVNLASSNTSRVTVGAPSVTIPTGQTSATFSIGAVDNAVADGNATVNITASATGFAVSVVPVTVIDNDTAGITVTPTSGLQTTIAGGTASFTVQLNSQPTADVTIGLTSSNTSAGTVSPSSLTFNATNWNQPQTVTVTGVNNFMASGNQAYNIITAPATSNDAGYSGFDAADVAVTNFNNNAAGIVVTPTSGLVTTEAGGTANFTIVLTSSPTANVTIPLASSNPAEGTVSASALTFTPANWNQPQTVAVTGVADKVADGDQVYTIVTGATTSGDANYNGLNPDDVAVTNKDVDTPTLSLSLNATTVEGTPITGTVTRNTPVTSDLTVALSSSNPAIPVPGSVTIPAGHSLQTFSINNPDDNVAQGDRSTTITATATALGLTDSKPLTITDNDMAMLTLSIAPTTFAESASAVGTLTRNTSLDTPLNVTLSIANTSNGHVSPAKLTDNNGTTISSILIPAGSASVTFKVVGIPDGIFALNRAAVVAATAGSITATPVQLLVTDSDPAPTPIPPTPVPTPVTPTPTHPTPTPPTPTPTPKIPAPAITSFSPASGPVSSLVTINGTNLDGAVVKFGTVAATVNAALSSATQLVLTVPSVKVGSATVTVTTPSGSASKPFTVTAPGKTFGISGTVLQGTKGVAGTKVFLIPTTSKPTLAAIQAIVFNVLRAPTQVTQVPVQSNGNYSFKGLVPGSYLVAPYKPGTPFTLTPYKTGTPLVSYKVITVAATKIGDIVGLNFIAQPADATKPVVTVTSPTTKAPYMPAQVPTATGTVTDAGSGVLGLGVALGQVNSLSLSGIKVSFYNWVTNRFDAPVTLTFSGSPLSQIKPEALKVGTLSGATWSVALPKNLAVGSYRVLPLGVDKAFNLGYPALLGTSGNFTVGSVQTHTVASPSTLELSSSSVSVVTDSITLKFLGALDADAASDAAHYSVKVNGVAVTPESAGYNAVAHTVTLALPEGTLQNGDAVAVQWSDLQDAQGKSLAGQTGTATAK